MLFDQNSQFIESLTRLRRVLAAACVIRAQHGSATLASFMLVLAEGFSPFSHNREVDHVPAYSRSNRWVRVGGTCSDERVVIGEIGGSQGNRNYRRGAV